MGSGVREGHIILCWVFNFTKNGNKKTRPDFQFVTVFQVYEVFVAALGGERELELKSHKFRATAKFNILKRY